MTIKEMRDRFIDIIDDIMINADSPVAGEVEKAADAILAIVTTALREEYLIGARADGGGDPEWEKSVKAEAISRWPDIEV